VANRPYTMLTRMAHGRGLMVGLATLVCLLFPIQLETLNTIGFRFAPVDVALVGLAAVVLLRHAASRHLAVSVPLVLRVAAVLVGWLIVSSIINAGFLGKAFPVVFVTKVVGSVSMLVFYSAAYLATVEELTLHLAARIYVFAGSAWNLVGLLAYALDRLSIHSPLVTVEGRLAGLLIDPNAYGGYVLSVLLVGLSLPQSWRRGFSFYRVNLLLLFLGVLLSFSRSAWVGLAMGLIALFLLLPRLQRRTLAISLSVLAACGTLTVLFVGPIREWVWNSGFALRHLAPRVDILTAAWDAFWGNPIFGIGLGSFSRLPESGGLIVHSTPAWLLAETGLVGFALFALVVICGYVESRRARGVADPDSRLLLAGISASLVGWLGFMVGIEAFYQRHYWWLMGILGAAYVLSRKRTPQGEG